MKKLFVFFIVFLTMLNSLSFSASAENFTKEDLMKMSDYDYYCTFAEALKSHDSYTISLFIDCCPKYHGQFYGGKTCKEAGCTAYKQFDYLRDIKISSYSVELLDESDMMSRSTAKITLTIDKGDDNLFPKGKSEYNVLLDKYSGENGIFIFKPYNQKSVRYNSKYSDIIFGSALLSEYLNDFGSASESQLKNTVYDAATIHVLYHTMLGDSDDGITKSELNSKLQNFFNSSNTVEKHVLQELPKNNDMYFNMCGQGMPIPQFKCNKITRNTKTGLYTIDIWYYSDRAYMNVCRKIKYTYKINGDSYTIKTINCYYSNEYDVITL